MRNRKYLSALLVTLLACGSLGAFPEQQSTEKPNKIGFIQVGRITKVDQKNHTITIRSTDASADQARGIPGEGPEFGRGGGFRHGGFGGGRRGGGNSGQRGSVSGVETNVLTTDTTVIKNDAGEVITLNALHVDDFVRINGVTKEKDFEAKEIQLSAPPPGGRRESR
jgi:hypothetical protein